MEELRKIRDKLADVRRRYDEGNAADYYSDALFNIEMELNCYIEKNEDDLK